LRCSVGRLLLQELSSQTLCRCRFCPHDPATCPFYLAFFAIDPSELRFSTDFPRNQRTASYLPCFRFLRPFFICRTHKQKLSLFKDPSFFIRSLQFLPPAPILEFAVIKEVLSAGVLGETSSRSPPLATSQPKNVARTSPPPPPWFLVPFPVNSVRFFPFLSHKADLRAACSFFSEGRMAFLLAHRLFWFLTHPPTRRHMPNTV